MRLSRRRFLQASGALALTGLADRARGVGPKGVADRLIIFYFPDGVPGQSQAGDASKWHCTGSEHAFQLSPVLAPLAPFKDRCVFLNGLSMGPADSGSHPGGARKLLTGVNAGGGMSIDRYLAGTVGASSPHQLLYLGAQANHNDPSGDKHISYPSPNVSVPPADDPLQVFESLFSGGAVAPGRRRRRAGPDPVEVSVIDGVLDDMHALRAQLGATESQKLDLHLQALREVEKRIKQDLPALPPSAPASCDAPSLAFGLSPGALYAPESFPAVLRAQTDLLVQAMACGLTRVGTLQASHHTSELIMSRFEGTPMHDPGYDMRSHQASHYGAAHDPAKKEYAAFVQQRQWWVAQFAYLLEQLAARPDGDGTMLDTTLVWLCTEVSDGNTHQHDNMPFVLAGGAGGAFSTGRLLDFGYRRHGDLLASLAHAMGQPVDGFGQESWGPLPL